MDDWNQDLCSRRRTHSISSKVSDYPNSRQVSIGSGVPRYSDTDKLPRKDGYIAFALPFIRMSTSNCVACIFSIVPELINVVFIGRFGSVQELGAVGLGNTMQNTFALSIAFGLNTAFDFFTSTSGGAGEARLSMVYLARGRIAITLYFFLISPVLWYTNDILVALYQPPAVATFANDYNRMSLFGLWFFFQWNALQRFLQSQGQTRFITWLQVTIALLHSTWCYLFVGVWGMGNTGVGLANSTSWILQCVIVEIYFRIQHKSMGVTEGRWLHLHFTWEAWSGMPHYFKVAIPMAFLLWAEWAWWEILAIICGLFGEVQLAAHVSAFNFLALYFMVPLGINITTTFFFGQSIGKAKAALARRYMRMCIGTSFVIILAICIVTFVFADAIARLYTSDDAVLAFLIPLIQIGSFNCVPDGMQNVLGAFLRVCERQNAAAMVYFVQNFVVAGASVGLLSFHWHEGVIGIWKACTVGILFGVSSFSILIYSIDLDDEVQKTKDRIALESMQPLLTS